MFRVNKINLQPKEPVIDHAGMLAVYELSVDMTARDLLDQGFHPSAIPEFAELDGRTITYGYVPEPPMETRLVVPEVKTLGYYAVCFFGSIDRMICVSTEIDPEKGYDGKFLVDERGNPITDDCIENVEIRYDPNVDDILDLAAVRLAYNMRELMINGRQTHPCFRPRNPALSSFPNSRMYKWRDAGTVDD